MSIQPLVSVIIPVFNSEAYIAATLESVFSQSYQNFEVIVIDDGSTDGILQHLACYGEKILVISQRNSGPAAARNLGIVNARGDVVAFLDADDLWPKERLKNMVALLNEHPEADIVRGQIERLGGLSQREAAIGQENLGPFSPVSAIYRKRVFTIGMFDPSMRAAEDLDWYLRLQEHGVVTIFYPAPSVIYRRTNGISANFDTVNTGLIGAIRRKLAREKESQ